MTARRTLSRILVASAVTGALVVLGSGPASAHGGKTRVLLDGLSSPKGITLDGAGHPVVSQGAFGPPGPVLAFINGEGVELTPPLGLVDIAFGAKAAWGIGLNEAEEGILYRQSFDSDEPVEVLNITEYQAGDPDPYDQEGAPEESNPYGLAALPGGDALVADAAGNDIIRVTPKGKAWTVARFRVTNVKTDHIPFPPPPEFGIDEWPPTIAAEAVPTSIAIGPHGDVLVGQLMGFPFRPGSSSVWRLDPDAKGAVCARWHPNRKCSVYKSGLTSIQDVAYDRFRGKLYVYELAKDGALAFEAGFETGEFPPAVLLQIKGHHRHELAKGKLSEPGGVVVSRHGKVYVTDGMFSSGRLLRVK